jgi:hypothetical protein
MPLTPEMIKDESPGVDKPTAPYAVAVAPDTPQTATPSTPGPWFCREYGSPKGRFYITTDPGGRAGNTLAQSLRCSEADAQLMAAAPDLLDALKGVCKVQTEFKTWANAGVMRGLLPYTEADLRKASLGAFDKAAAAIAKATGAA